MGTLAMINRSHLLKESKDSVQKLVRNHCLKFCSHNSPKKYWNGNCANNFENSNKEEIARVRAKVAVPKVVHQIQPLQEECPSHLKEQDINNIETQLSIGILEEKIA